MKACGVEMGGVFQLILISEAYKYQHPIQTNAVRRNTVSENINSRKLKSCMQCMYMVLNIYMIACMV